MDIRLHTIIYNVTDEIKKAMTGLLAVVFKETTLGRAEVRDTFRISKVGTVAGCYIQDGKITREAPDPPGPRQRGGLPGPNPVPAPL